MTKEINDKLELTRELIYREFSSISGISFNKLTQNELEKLKGMELLISKKIFGQQEAITKLSNAVKVARVGKRNKGRPQAAFLFMGPSGVGKTEIAKVLAAWDEKTLDIFDMSEYMEKHAVAKMIGAPPGYEGFDVGGRLTNMVRKNGNRIILFDEIEKAHEDIFNIFLQILSDGRLTDGIGRTVTFEDTVLIFTTNIGQRYYLDESMTFDQAENLALEDLSNTYKSEFLNRFAGRQNIVPFKKLEIESIVKIVKREIDSIGEVYREKGIEIVMADDQIYTFCKNTYDATIGARGLPGYIQSTLEPAIVNQILDHPDEQVTMNITYDTNGRHFVIDTSS